jgi:hypothetical protein
MLLSDMYPSKWLSADDLPDGISVVTIRKIAVEELGQSRERKPVIDLAEYKKRWIVNRTNARKLGELLGKDSTAWIGKRIELVVRDVDVGGESHRAIRVTRAIGNPRPDVPLEAAAEASPF